MSPSATAALTLADWRAAYRDGASPELLIRAVSARLGAEDPAWIHRCGAPTIDAQLVRLATQPRASLPLWGVPFAVKDNIDAAGLPTTAACPAFAYTATANATVVERLMATGAVLVGKTNLDQFATGLVGTRSPYGEVPNSVDPAYVSGGSSSGSASVVARGLVPFALGTDTAGSGRVPAGFNNVVGLKPTLGRMPMGGVLPACRTLDVVSVLALTVADAAEVMAAIEGPTAEEPLFNVAPLRPPWLGRSGEALRAGVPDDPGCDGALGYARAFEAALEQLASLGVELHPIAMQPLFDVAQLLYEGPWIAERHAVVRALLQANPEALDASVRRVIEHGSDFDAASVFSARYRLEDARRRIEHEVWDRVDVLMLPTAPTCPTRAAVAADPIARNSELGRYTNFVNLLGQAALALPAGFTAAGLPFGITFVAPGGSDAALCELGARWEAASGATPLGAHLRQACEADRRLGALPTAAPTLALAVVGAHLSGLPLHGQLQARGCRLQRATRTAARYRLFELPGSVPAKPGLLRVAEGGVAIELEVYDMPQDAVGSFLAAIAPPLSIGSVELEDGTWVKGFLCEPAALHGARDISVFGGWRAWLRAQIK